jgi:hypothetical protein
MRMLRLVGNSENMGHATEGKERLRYFLENRVLHRVSDLRCSGCLAKDSLLGASAILILLVWIEFRRPIAIALLSLVLTIAVLLYVFTPTELPTETSEHGWLLPANEPTPSTGCHLLDLPDDPGILFVAGHSGILTNNPGKTVRVFGCYRPIAFGHHLDSTSRDRSFRIGRGLVCDLRTSFHFPSTFPALSSDRAFCRPAEAVAPL